LVYAVSENGIIGCRGRLPWHLPDDLKRFKELTTGHVVVMGRKTFESLGGPLPNRRNVVLTRNRTFAYEGVVVVHELADALQIADSGAEMFFIGGAEVYRESLAHACRVHQTLVHASVAGDSRFDDFDIAGWKLVEEQSHDADELHEHRFTYRVFERV
jgi:dihydrofolate reductase